MYFEEDIDACVEVIRKGGVILYPTDTVWGLGCDARNEEAVKKIFALKQRDEAKSMIVLVGDEKEILNYVGSASPTVFDFIKESRKPVTVIYDRGKNLAKNVLSEDGSIGIRIPKELFCQQLLKKLGHPIVSTSSNISGYPTPMTFLDIDQAIIDGVDYVVRYRQDETVPGQPSTVIKLHADNTYTIIRP